MKNFEDILCSPDVPFAKSHYSNNTRHFHLTAKPIRHSILSNICIDALGYNCSTPGPVIVIKQVNG